MPSEFNDLAFFQVKARKMLRQLGAEFRLRHRARRQHGSSQDFPHLFFHAASMADRHLSKLVTNIVFDDF